MMEKKKNVIDCDVTQPNAKKFKASEKDTKETNIETLFASTNQADENIFIAISFLTRNVTTKQWNQRELNAVLTSGDELYRLIVSRCRQKFKPVPYDGYLDINHIDVISQNLRLHEHQWRIRYNDNEVKYSS